MTPRLLLPLLLLSSLLSATTAADTAASPAADSPPASDSCNGVYLSYTFTGGEQLPPNLLKSDPTHQPYSFKSTLQVLNNGLQPLKSWQVFVGFQHDEYLVSASNAVLTDGNSIPGSVGNGTVFAGYPSTDLSTAALTAGDVNQMQAMVDLVGTEYGVNSSAAPMPTNISLAMDGWLCPTPTNNGTRQMQVCCTEDPTLKTNVTTTEFLPRQNGDLIIMYDVIRTYDTNYWAHVTITNNNSLGRLDNWKLSWDWMREEFIYAMKGAYPEVLDTTDCINGKQGQYYAGTDFSTVLNCERRPTIVDLPPNFANNTNLGLIPFCCRNGTILPPSMDPSKSISAFQINVQKMPPDLNRSHLSPPQNWQINGTLNPDYKCGPPVQVSPSLYPDPNGSPADVAAFASWQVVCNITQPKGVKPKCCVSFSAFYNESVIPCSTCACGCPSPSSKTCSTTAPALLLPSQALLVPFDNRTTLANAWAVLNHFATPNPLPCGDNCGVSINWHLYTDYAKGWTARITLFNWDGEPFVDWFTAVELDKAAPGFEKMYSFNGTLLSGVDNVNTTIFMQGLPGLNYLVAEVPSGDPKKDPPVPGKQQSVISFTKKLTPGINVPGGDGFPSKVYFNGDECSLPTVLPTGSAHRKGSNISISVLLAIVVTFLIMRW